MDRRRFLKTLGVAAMVAPTAPGTLFGVKGWDKKKYPAFDPKLEYGHMVQTSGPDFDREACIKELDEQIEEAIPPNYRRYIRYQLLSPTPTAMDPLARRGIVAWKYSTKRRMAE